MQQQF